MILNKTTITDLKNIKGEVRGVTFQTNAKYILSREGETGLKKLEKRAKEMNTGIDYRTAKTMEWYPVGLGTISLLLIKETFGWKDEDIVLMGKHAPKVSFVAKIFFKLFLSLDKLTKQVPRFWQQHFTVGDLQIISFDEKKKILFLRVTGLDLHPIFCIYLAGYIETVMALTRQSKSVKVKEIKCSFKQKVKFHEYKVTWQ